MNYFEGEPEEWPEGWTRDDSPPETKKFPRTDTTYRARHASHRGRWILGWVVGLSVGGVALWAGLQATPPGGKTITITETSTKTLPAIEVTAHSTRWKTATKEITGPAIIEPGPTVTVTKTRNVETRITITATAIVTETETVEPEEEEPDDN